MRGRSIVSSIDPGVDDQGLLGGLQSLPAWNKYFGSPSGLRLGVIAATLFLPGIPFAFIAEWITTRFGRRIPIWIGCGLVLVGSLIQTFSQNAGMFMASELTRSVEITIVDNSSCRDRCRRGHCQSCRPCLLARDLSSPSAVSFVDPVLLLYLCRKYFIGYIHS